MVTPVICLSISCAIILLKEKSNYPDNHLLMTYLVILLCETLVGAEKNRNYKP